VAASGGALDIPRNDDWSYLENAFRFSETGIVAVGGWVQMMLIGQLLLAAPIIAITGPLVLALQVLVGVLGVVFLMSAYLFLRSLLSARAAFFAMVVTAISVPYALLATSFMTDVPAAAFQLVALALAVPALATDRLRWGYLLAASVAALYAVSIREYAVVALGAIWLTVMARHRGTSRAALLAWTAALALAVLGMFFWRAGQVTVTDSPLGLDLGGIRYVAWWPLMAGLLLLPVVLAANPRLVVERAWRDSRTLTLLVALLVALALLHSRFGLLGNYLSLTGGYSEVIRGNSPSVLPAWLAVALTALSALSALLLGLLALSGALGALRRRRSLTSPLILAVSFVALTALVLTLAPVIARVAMFDRYFLAVLPVTAGLTLAWIHRAGMAWGARPLLPPMAALAGMTIVSLILAAATAAFDGARTRLANDVAGDLGVAQGNVDGGFDYYDFNTNGAPRPETSTVRWTWWTARLAQRAVCATVMFEDYGEDSQAAGPLSTAVPIARVEVKSPFASTRTLVVYQGPDTC
jgi:hypothetical protein